MEEVEELADRLVTAVRRLRAHNDAAACYKAGRQAGKTAARIAPDAAPPPPVSAPQSPAEAEPAVITQEDLRYLMILDGALRQAKGASWDARLTNATYSVLALKLPLTDEWRERVVYRDKGESARRAVAEEKARQAKEEEVSCSKQK